VKGPGAVLTVILSCVIFAQPLAAPAQSADPGTLGTKVYRVGTLVPPGSWAA
jgi:hypothetical protein